MFDTNLYYDITGLGIGNKRTSLALAALMFSQNIILYLREQSCLLDLLILVLLLVCRNCSLLHMLNMFISSAFQIYILNG